MMTEVVFIEKFECSEEGLRGDQTDDDRGGLYREV